MKRTVMDDELAAALDRLTADLWKCQQCGACTAVCPSGRQGGIHCGELMARAALGAFRDDDKVWKCACCQGCTERCPSGVDVAAVIEALRGRSAARGAAPAYFREEAQRFLQTGLSFPRTGLTKKIRQELGLEELEISETAREELAAIVARTKLGRLRLE